MENFHHKGLTIEFRKGMYEPKFDNNHLVVYSDFTDWNYFQKADICIGKDIVSVSSMHKNGEMQFSNVYLIYDYEVWNRRGFKDMSVIKNLEKEGSKILPRRDKHTVTLDFGRSNEGKATLEQLALDIRNKFSVINNDETVRFRKWDQTKDILFRQNITKATIEAGQDVLEEFVVFLNDNDFQDESTSLNEQLLRALFEKVEIELDFKERFKKKKKSKV